MPGFVLIILVCLLRWSQAASLPFCAGQGSNASGPATAHFGSSLGSSSNIDLMFENAINVPDQPISSNKQLNWVDYLWTHAPPDAQLDPVSKCVIAFLNTTKEDDVKGANDPGDCSTLFPSLSNASESGDFHVAMTNASRNALQKLGVNSPAKLDQLHDDYCDSIKDDMQAWWDSSSGMGGDGLAFRVAAAWTSSSAFVANQTCQPPSSSDKWTRFPLPSTDNPVYPRKTFNEISRRVLPLISVLTEANNGQAIRPGSGVLNCITTRTFSPDTIEPPTLSANSLNTEPSSSPTASNPSPSSSQSSSSTSSAPDSQPTTPSTTLSPGATAGIAIGAAAASLAILILSLILYLRSRNPSSPNPFLALLGKRAPKSRPGSAIELKQANESTAEIDSAVFVEMPVDRPREELHGEAMPHAELSVPTRDMGLHELPGSPVDAFGMDKKWALPPS